MTIAAPTATQQLDVTRRQRGETIRFDLLDQLDNKIDELLVERDRPPVVSNDITRRIRRRCEGLYLDPRIVGSLDAFSTRVQPWRVLGTGEQYSRGIFIFDAETLHVLSYGYESPCTLGDKSVILDQRLTQNLNYNTGADIRSALIAIAAMYGITNYSIDVTGRTVTAPYTAALGRDTGLTAMEALCELGGYLMPYFTNTGQLRVRAAIDPASEPYTVTAYGANTRVIADTVDVTSDLLDAPNRYIAIDTSASGNLAAFYDIPASAPNSYAHRGFYIVAPPIERAGFASVDAALDACKAAYAQDSLSHQMLAFNSTPDPRHDTYDYYSFDGVRYREVSWREPLSCGAPMSHDARAVL